MAWSPVSKAFDALTHAHVGDIVIRAILEIPRRGRYKRQPLAAFSLDVTCYCQQQLYHLPDAENGSRIVVYHRTSKLQARVHVNAGDKGVRRTRA